VALSPAMATEAARVAGTVLKTHKIRRISRMVYTFTRPLPKVRLGFVVKIKYDNS